MEIRSEILIDPTKQETQIEARLLAYKKVASENTRLNSKIPKEP